MWEIKNYDVFASYGGIADDAEFISAKELLLDAIPVQRERLSKNEHIDAGTRSKIVWFKNRKMQALYRVEFVIRKKDSKIFRRVRKIYFGRIRAGIEEYNSELEQYLSDLDAARNRPRKSRNELSE